MSEVFQFQQFYVRHDQCAMKVGTDAVLLGAWCRPDTAIASPVILDVGTGSGIIALILAQRFPNAVIRGIELDRSAAEQCAGNFRESPWPERLTAEHVSLRDFARSQLELRLDLKSRIDLLVCNPPYFAANRHLAAAGASRRMARQDHHLPLEDLVMLGGQLLSQNGKISLVLPFESGREIRQLAASNGLMICRETHVSQLADKPPSRLLVELDKGTHGNSRPEKSELILLRSRTRNDFTNEFREMVNDLYLKSVVEQS